MSGRDGVKDMAVNALIALKEYLERIAEDMEESADCGMDGEEPLCCILCNNNGCLRWHIAYADRAIATKETPDA